MLKFSPKLTDYKKWKFLKILNWKQRIKSFKKFNKIISFFKIETLENDLRVGDIVLPEIISNDGKLTFKQINIPQNLELNCHTFTDAIKNIISADGDFNKQFCSIWTENTDEYFCYAYENESNFLSLIEQALFIRIIEFGNTELSYTYFINCINEQIAQLLS